MCTVDKHIEINNKLANDSDEFSTKITVNDSNERHMLFVGFFRTALSHFAAINLLIEKKLYGSAFALIRVLFETTIRGLYSYLIFDDVKISSMYRSDNWDTDDFFRSKLSVMCEELDTHLNKDILKDIKDRVYERMCDYTHTGATQIARNFNEENELIEPNFDDELIIDTLEGSNMLFEMISKYYLNIGVEQSIIHEDEAITLLEKNNEHISIETEKQEEPKELNKITIKPAKKSLKRTGLKIVKKAKASV